MNVSFTVARKPIFKRPGYSREEQAGPSPIVARNVIR
jgi:hypothetical protein